MVRLGLIDEEAREVALALEAQAHGLRLELVRADVRAFKAVLRRRLETLEELSRRLAVSQRDAAGVAAPDARREERLADPDAAEEEAEELLAGSQPRREA